MFQLLRNGFILTTEIIHRIFPSDPANLPGGRIWAKLTGGPL
jgi:hypothetical protein